MKFLWVWRLIIRHVPCKVNERSFYANGTKDAWPLWNVKLLIKCGPTPVDLHLYTWAVTWVERSSPRLYGFTRTTPRLPLRGIPPQILLARWDSHCIHPFHYAGTTEILIQFPDVLIFPDFQHLWNFIQHFPLCVYLYVKFSNYKKP